MTEIRGMKAESDDQKYENESLTKEIIEAIIKVHQTLGPGFLEIISRISNTPLSP